MMEVRNLRACLVSPRLPLPLERIAVVLPTTMMRLRPFRGREGLKAVVWVKGRMGLLCRQLVVMGLVIPGQVVRLQVAESLPSPGHREAHRFRGWVRWAGIHREAHLQACRQVRARDWVRLRVRGWACLRVRGWACRRVRMPVARPARRAVARRRAMRLGR